MGRARQRALQGSSRGRRQGTSGLCSREGFFHSRFRFAPEALVLRCPRMLPSGFTLGICTHIRVHIALTLGTCTHHHHHAHQSTYCLPWFPSTVFPNFSAICLCQKQETGILLCVHPRVTFQADLQMQAGKKTIYVLIFCHKIVSFICHYGPQSCIVLSDQA